MEEPEKSQEPDEECSRRLHMGSYLCCRQVCSSASALLPEDGVHHRPRSPSRVLREYRQTEKQVGGQGEC
jgi:hypothetical protein